MSAHFSSSLEDPAVSRILAELYQRSEGDMAVVDEAKKLAAGWDAPPTLAQTVELTTEALLPVDPKVGRLLYQLVRTLRPHTVVEFGTSFGISAIHLAAALRDNGQGRLVTSELNAHKVAEARKNLATAGLADLVEVLEGDARETLAGVEGPIDFLLLDGWKDLCLPVLELLEPQLHEGSVIIADNLAQLPEEFTAKVRSTANGYFSTDLPLFEGIEVITRIAP